MTKKNYIYGKTPDVEKSFTLIESLVAHILNRIIETKNISDLSEKELFHLLFFISLQHTRTMKAKEGADSFLKQLPSFMGIKDWEINSGTIHTDNYIENPFGASIDTGEITDGTILEIDLNVDEIPVNNDILSFDDTGNNFSWQTPIELGLLYGGGTLTDTQLCVADGTSGALDCNIAQSYYVQDGCIDCLNATEIEDIYILNTGENNERI